MPLTDDTNPSREAMPPRLGESTRETEPANFTMNRQGGVAFVARRGAESGLMSTRSALERMAGDSPLRLLSYLADVHPTLGLALWNLLRLAAPPDGVSIVAVAPDSAEEGAGEQDDAGTARIAELFASQPKEVGGLHGLMTTGLLTAALTGLPVFEAVPGARMKGLRRVYPVDSLTLRINREGPDNDSVLYQQQRQPSQGNRTGYKRLTPERMFWRPLDSLPDDPYGRAPLAPALGEILRDLALIQDLSDAIHNAAWPRLAIPFNFAETYKLAVEVYKITDVKKAGAWVMEQFTASVAEYNKLKPSSNIHFDASGGAKLFAVEGSKGLAALEPMLEYLRQRVVQAVKSLPTLMGINDGSTQTYTTVEWSIYAAGLETLRFIVVDLLVQMASLHLQLLGLPLVARAEYEPIRTTDAMIEAQTESTRIENAIKKREQGWWTNDQASQDITGNDAVAEPQAPPAPAGTGGTLPTAGTTQEERDAQRNRVRPAGSKFYRVQGGKCSLLTSF